MSEYREGDRVRITIDDAVIVNTYPHTKLPDANGRVATDHVVVYRTDAQEGQSSSVVLEDPAVTVERVAPADWPPLPGDKWRDRNGSAWFAFYGLEAREVFMIPADPIEGPLTTPTPATVLAKVGPLTLVHREDEQDGSTR